METSMGSKLDLRIVAAVVLAVLAVGVGASWLAHQIRTLPSGEALAARAEQRVVTLEVGGMTCGNCAATVASKLTAVPGVSNAAVRYAQRRAYVVCDKTVADTALVAAVHRAGPGFLASIAR
jgi:copper chaperone CopZ